MGFALVSAAECVSLRGHNIMTITQFTGYENYSLLHSWPIHEPNIAVSLFFVMTEENLAHYRASRNQYTETEITEERIENSWFIYGWYGD